jgi:hypothetical protein
MIGNGNRVVHTDATLTGAGSAASPLAVAAPGLVAVSTDATLTGDGTAGDPLVVAAPYPGDPSVGGTRAERVDTSAFETVRRCAGDITAAADSSTSPGVKTTVSSAGHEQTEGTSVTIAGTTDYNGAHVVSNVTTDTFDIEVVYTSSQTGTFWADNEYKAPAAFQLGGAFGALKMRKFKGLSGGATTTVWASSGITKPPMAFGYLVDSATGNTMNLLGYISAVGIGGLQVNSGAVEIKAGTSYDDATDSYEFVLIYQN